MPDRYPVLYTFLQWFAENLSTISGVLSGATCYMLYGMVFERQRRKKAIVSFFIGAAFAWYGTKQMHQMWPWLDTGVLGYVLGLFGMRVVFILMTTDWKSVNWANVLQVLFKK